MGKTAQGSSYFFLAFHSVSQIMHGLPDMCSHKALKQIGALTWEQVHEDSSQEYAFAL